MADEDGYEWRCLLPFVSGQHLGVWGFSDAQERVWRGLICGAEWDGSNTEIDGWIINADAGVPESDLLAGSKWVAVLGSRRTVGKWRHSVLAQFPVVREYGLVPVRSPRIVVPLCSRRAARAGLLLHRPGRYAARVGLVIARGLARFGNYGLLRRRNLVIASIDGSAWSSQIGWADVGELTGRHRVDFALYLGGSGDRKKTVVLPLLDRDPSVILKMAEHAAAREALLKEARALRDMGGTCLASMIPMIVGLEEKEDRVTLVQEYRQRRQVNRWIMRDSVIRFIRGLSEINSEVVSIDTLLQSIGKDRVGSGVSLPSKGALPMETGIFGEGFSRTIAMSKAFSPSVAMAATRLQRRIVDLASCGAQVLVHRSHGDLAPWNCAWTDRGLFVFDWEESREQAMALSDAFYYVLAPYAHVHVAPDASKAVRAALLFGSQVIRRSACKLEPTGISRLEGIGKKNLNESRALSTFCISAPRTTPVLADVDIELYLAIWLLEHLEDGSLYQDMAVILERRWS